MNETLEVLAAQFGVPERVLRGEADPLLTSTMWKQQADKVEQQVRELVYAVVNPVIDKVVEDHFPEWYWEPMFLCSPRGRLMKRRKEPYKPRIEWTP